MVRILLNRHRANKALKVDELTYTQLKEIYSGENKSWGYITGQNINIYPVIFDRSGFLLQVAGYLNLKNYETGINIKKVMKLIMYLNLLIKKRVQLRLYHLIV